MPRESEATYRRRRLVALAAIAGVVALAAIALGGGDDPGDVPPDVARRLALDAEPVELTLSVSGDLLIHSPVYYRALELGGGTRYDFEPLFDEIRPWVEEPELAFCHVEVPMSDAVPPSGYPLFNTPPELARAIAATGWDACDTASNHSLDQGQDGVEATGRALDRAGVPHTGSYDSTRDQRRPLIVEADGVRVALLAYTTDTNGLPLPEPYSVNVADGPADVIRGAREARERGADAVIVNLHWGSELTPEYTPEPSEAQERFAAELARAPEITAVVGQGPHVVQPIRWIAGTPVVFSEGNLISNQSPAAGLSASSQDGLIALLDLVVDGEGDRIERVRYVPVWVRQPDYVVLPVGAAIEEGLADGATLEASYERTVSVVGRADGVRPVPARLP